MRYFLFLFLVHVAACKNAAAEEFILLCKAQHPEGNLWKSVPFLEFHAESNIGSCAAVTIIGMQLQMSTTLASPLLITNNRTSSRPRAAQPALPEAVSRTTSGSHASAIIPPADISINRRDLAAITFLSSLPVWLPAHAAVEQASTSGGKVRCGNSRLQTFVARKILRKNCRIGL